MLYYNSLGVVVVVVVVVVVPRKIGVMYNGS